MKMNRLNKILSTILSLCIVFGLLPIIAQQATAADSALMRGDINGDGTINAQDLTLLARYVAGMDEYLGGDIPPVEGKKIGIILVGDENEPYTYAHIDGITKAMQECGLSEKNIMWCYAVAEDNRCYEKCIECVEAGCGLIITNSYGHQSYAEFAAKENPDVQFISLYGDTALKSKLSNFANAYADVFEAHYVSGVVAGMKLKELLDEHIISDPYVGFVGAYPYAEVVSAYSAFFLGARSVVPTAHMDVVYANTWFDPKWERIAANSLIDRGCVIIGEYEYGSWGVANTVQSANSAGKTVYSIGNINDKSQLAPTSTLTSAHIDWSVYFTYLFSSYLRGEKIATDWSGGYDVGAVGITALGSKVAKGTAEKVAEVEAALANGTLHVFDTSTFTVGGEEVTSAFTFDSDGDWTNDTNEGIVDGYYHESEYISAPSFALRIDGIVELNCA